LPQNDEIPEATDADYVLFQFVDINAYSSAIEINCRRYSQLEALSLLSTPAALALETLQLKSRLSTLNNYRHLSQVELNAINNVLALTLAKVPNTDEAKNEVHEVFRDSINEVEVDISFYQSRI